MQLVACGTEKGSQKPRKATLFLPCAGYKLHVFSFARKLFVTIIKFPPKRFANAVKCCSKKRLHRGMNGRILYTTLWELLGEKHRCSYVLTFAGFVPHPHPPTPPPPPTIRGQYATGNEWTWIFDQRKWHFVSNCPAVFTISFFNQCLIFRQFCQFCYRMLFQQK